MSVPQIETGAIYKFTPGQLQKKNSPFFPTMQ